MRNSNSAATFLVVLGIWAAFIAMALVGMSGCTVPTLDNEGMVDFNVTSPDENGVTIGYSIWTPFSKRTNPDIDLTGGIERTYGPTVGYQRPVVAPNATIIWDNDLGVYVIPRSN